MPIIFTDSKLYLKFDQLHCQMGVLWTPFTGLTIPHFVPVPSQGLDSQHHMSWSVFCSFVWGERWLFVLLILVELLTSLF